VFAAKGRHPAKAVSLLVADVPMALPLTAGLPPSARALMEAFWPGPLTLILPPAQGLPSALVPPGGGIGLRAPRAAVAQAVLRALGGPVVGTSANRAGGPDPVDAATVLREVGRHLRLLLDAGPTAVGVASTVLDCTIEPPRLLRLGAVPLAALQAVLPNAGPWGNPPDPRKS
jgi:L-threonylcarbamoyladenylate synthase